MDIPDHLNQQEWDIDKDGFLVRRLGEWAREKLFYVERYIHIFNSGMRNRWPVRTYVDLFSGPGIVRIGSDDIPGSALLAASSQTPFTHLFFNDLEPLAIESLKRRIAALQVDSTYEYFVADCNAAAIQIRRLLPERSLDLCFIDPTNWQVTFDSIRKLTSGRRMDLIITFHVGSMKRAADYAPSGLDAFFGTSGWRDVYQSARRSGSRDISRVLLDVYESQLRLLGYKWVVDDVRITNTHNLGLYHLIFASKNERGEDFWQKITDRSAGGQRRLFRDEPGDYLA